MMQENLYELLGISKKSTIEEIKEAYKRKAKECHPDVNGGDSSLFLKIKKAYDILSNKSTREKYDKTGYIEHDKEDLILEAYNVISNSLQEFIKMHTIENKTDVLSIMLSNCLKKISGLKKMLLTLEKKRTMILVMKRRFKKKKNVDNHNYFEDILENLLSSVKQEMSQIHSQIEIYKYIKNILNGYEYICEKELPTFDDIEQANIELY